MEGDAKVAGEKVIFDPQSPNRPVSFKENRSEADHLAIVLNSTEARRLGGENAESEAV